MFPEGDAETVMRQVPARGDGFAWWENGWGVGKPAYYRVEDVSWICDPQSSEYAHIKLTHPARGENER